VAARFYKALWGMDGELEQQIQRIAGAGYAGFEAPVFAENASGIAKAVSDSGLGFIAMLFVMDADELRVGLEHAASAGAEKINVHSGRDWWHFDEGCRFFEQALRVQEASSAPVAHETHRGRTLFHPAVTRTYLDRFPDLRLTADFSHWTNVCESMLGDQEEAVGRAIDATIHLHARVGYEQGPQVPDPRAPEWEPYVATFEQWWDRILRRHEERGEILTVDPEFGPPHYMHTIPHTREPVADLWDVCLWMRDRLATRWS
jgi:sugar phosphate isomerase/epimerase